MYVPSPFPGPLWASQIYASSIAGIYLLGQRGHVRSRHLNLVDVVPPEIYPGSSPPPPLHLLPVCMELLLVYGLLSLHKQLLSAEHQAATVVDHMSFWWSASISHGLGSYNTSKEAARKSPGMYRAKLQDLSMPFTYLMF